MNKAYQTIINIAQHSTCTALLCTVLQQYCEYTDYFHLICILGFMHDAKLILGTCIIIIYSVIEVVRCRLYKMILP